MTPYEIELERESRDDKQAEAMQDEYLSGVTDAAFGDLPRYSNDAYLAGYCSRLKELPVNSDGTIQYHNPSRSFAYGYCDGDPDYLDEF